MFTNKVLWYKQNYYTTNQASASVYKVYVKSCAVSAEVLLDLCCIGYESCPQVLSCVMWAYYSCAVPNPRFQISQKWLQSSHCQSKGGIGKQHGVLVMARLACVWQDKKHFMYCNRNIFLPCVFKQPHLLFHHVIPHWYSDSLFALCSLGHAHIEDDFCFTRRQGVTSTVWRGDQAASQCRWWLASCPDLPWGWVRQTSRQGDKQTD